MVQGVKNILKDNNGITLFKYLKTGLSKIKIDILGTLKVLVLKIRNHLKLSEIPAANIPGSPADGQGGIIYVKSSERSINSNNIKNILCL